MTQCRLRDGRIRAGEVIGDNEPVRNIQRGISSGYYLLVYVSCLYLCMCVCV